MKINFLCIYIMEYVYIFILFGRSVLKIDKLGGYLNGKIWNFNK